MNCFRQAVDVPSSWYCTGTESFSGTEYLTVPASFRSCLYVRMAKNTPKIATTQGQRQWNTHSESALHRALKHRPHCCTELLILNVLCILIALNLTMHILWSPATHQPSLKWVWWLLLKMQRTHRKTEIPCFNSSIICLAQNWPLSMLMSLDAKTFQVTKICANTVITLSYIKFISIFIAWVVKHFETKILNAKYGYSLSCLISLHEVLRNASASRRSGSVARSLKI